MRFIGIPTSLGSLLNLWASGCDFAHPPLHDTWDVNPPVNPSNSHQSLQ
jgi:hypothetical protein